MEASERSPAHLTSADCCYGQETGGKSRPGAREVFELTQPTSCAAQCSGAEGPPAPSNLEM